MLIEEEYLSDQLIYRSYVLLCDAEVKLAVGTATRNTPPTLMMQVPRCRLHMSGTTPKTEELVGDRNSCSLGFKTVAEAPTEQTDGKLNRRSMTEEVRT